MFILILSLLVGISFFPLCFMDMEKFLMWHAQGIWVQTMIMIAFSWSFFENPKFVPRRNIPLGLVHLWVGGSTAVVCTLSQIAGVYNYWTLFPYFNFLCLVILYTLVTKYITKEQTKIILEWLRYVIIATLIMCVLQLCGLSQFFKLMQPGWTGTYYNLVTGFIGNGTHLSGFLAMCIPLFFLNKTRENYLALILLGLVLCLSGTSVGDPSISGFVIAGFVLIYLSKRKYLTIGILGGIAICAGIILYRVNPRFLLPTGRNELWLAYLPLVKDRFILGSGLGTVKLLSTQEQFPDAHHLHLEYYQYLVELGCIGLVLIGNLILEFIMKKPLSRTDKVLKAGVYGFLLSCFFNFPGHLWLPSTFAVFMYAAFLTQENDNGIFPQGTKGFGNRFNSSECDTDRVVS